MFITFLGNNKKTKNKTKQKKQKSYALLLEMKSSQLYFFKRATGKST
jgi:hypothetical protein